MPPNSCIKKILIFHNNKWWDKHDSLYSHKFKEGKRYMVTIIYNQDDKKIAQYLFEMPILGWNEGSGRTWEFWYRVAE